MEWWEGRVGRAMEAVDMAQALCRLVPTIDEDDDKLTMCALVNVLPLRVVISFLAFALASPSPPPASPPSLHKLALALRLAADPTRRYYADVLTASHSSSSPPPRLVAVGCGRLSRAVMAACASGLSDGVRTALSKKREASPGEVVVVDIASPPQQSCSDHDEQEPPEKKARTLKELPSSDAHVERVRSLVASKSNEELFEYLSKHPDMPPLPSEVSTDESYLVELLQSAPDAVVRLLVAPQVSRLLGSKPPSRQLANSCVKYCKSREAASLLSPLLLAAHELSKHHVTLAQSCVKSRKDVRVEMVRAVTDGVGEGKVIVNEFLVNLATFLVDCPDLRLDGALQRRCVAMLRACVDRHPAMFAVGKLVLAFVKRQAADVLRRSEDEDCCTAGDELAVVVSSITSSLSKVCRSTFDKLLSALAISKSYDLCPLRCKSWNTDKASSANFNASI